MQDSLSRFTYCLEYGKHRPGTYGRPTIHRPSHMAVLCDTTATTSGPVNPRVRNAVLADDSYPVSYWQRGRHFSLGKPPQMEVLAPWRNSTGDLLHSFHRSIMHLRRPRNDECLGGKSCPFQIDFSLRRARISSFPIPLYPCCSTSL